MASGISTWSKAIIVLVYNEAMKIVTEKDANIGDICQVLEKNGLVIFPCETTYGAAVDATSEKAVDKLNKYKRRPMGKPYSILCADQKMAEKFVLLNKTAKELYKKFLPGPVTIISRIKTKLARGVSSELGTVGVRVSNYKFMTDLIKAFGKPVTATSANASYQKRPYKVADILDNISEKQKQLIDLMIDAGELPHNEPSTVIDTTFDDVVTLRQGEIVINHQSSIVSRSEENTQNAGKELWQKYEKFAGQRAIIFALVGEMGAGKTQFVKGLAKAMQITDTIVSPTFNLDLLYKNNNLVLHHMDMWRVQKGEELEELGLKGLINDKSVLAIEWADRVDDIVRKYNEEAVIVWIKIKYGKKENERIINWGNI